MSLELKGKITHIGDVEVINDKFSKRIFVIEVQDGSFAKSVALQFTNDKCGKLDGIAKGAQVHVKFNIESREYNGKWFTNLTAWYLGAGEAMTAQQPQPQTSQSNNVDDLPF